MYRTLGPGSYFGTTEDRYDFGGLSVAQTTYPANFDIPPHEHINAFFCFVVQGLGTRSWRGRSGREAAMSLTLFPAGHQHANHWYGTGAALHIEFGDEWRRMRGSINVLTAPRDFDSGAPCWLARRLALEYSEQDDVSPLAIEGLALELLAQCSRSAALPGSGRAAPWLTKATAVLKDRFAEPRLTLTELSALVGVSADHLAKTFRLHEGCTVGQYVRNLRVEWACTRLAKSHDPLAEIALAAGFADQSHFAKVFRRKMQMTPSAFRALHATRRIHTNG